MIENLNANIGINLDHFSELEIISAWFRFAYKNTMAVALWRLPGTTEKQLVIDSRSELRAGKVDLEETNGGFLFAPFENKGMSRDLFFEKHIHYTSEYNQIQFSRLNALSPEVILHQLSMELESNHKQPYLHFSNQTGHTTSEDEYTMLVRKALESIESRSLQKVVPSVSRTVQLQNDFDCLDTFEKLCSSYPDAFISLVTAPGVGTWMGASPEPIIELDRSKTFSTAALAGTQAYQQSISTQEAAWKQKEIEEQALVSRYIINCFKKIRLREFEEIGPKTVVAGNLLHLKTTYTVDMEATKFPLLGSVMLDLLHPTSAVCGMPKEFAMEFIRSNEKFDRAFFSGYLGPVNLDEETHLFVNLRCMQINHSNATLYAGAGVTEDSDPYHEWVETQLKCDTLIDVLDL